MVNVFIHEIVEFVKNKDINIKFQDPIFTESIDKNFLQNTYKSVLNSKPAIIIFDGSNTQYEKIKQTFSLWGISNQCVDFNKLIKKNKNSNVIEINKNQIIKTKK